MSNYENMTKEQLICEVERWKNKCKIIKNLYSSAMHGLQGLYISTCEELVNIDWEIFEDKE